MDAADSSLRRAATGPLQGVALALYFVLLPYIVETKWRFSYGVTNGAILRDLLVGLTIFWGVFLALLVIYVVQLRHSRTLPRNGCAWLAGVIMMALPFLVATSAQASVATRRVSVAAAVTSPQRAVATADLTSGRHHVTRAPSHYELFTLALVARGRRNRLRTTGALDGEDFDTLAQRLHEGDEHLVAQLREVIGSDIDGEVVVNDDAFDAPARSDFEPVVVSLLGPRRGGLFLGYAREGGALPVDLSRTSEELAFSIVGLHDGTVRFAQSDNELVRALARRRDASTVVVFLGDPAEIDEELRELCVTLRPASGTAHFSSAPARRVRVELLRAYPQVQGLAEDFTPTLRRRCVEMVAYLAMHSGEPVTGDRLRTRVLVHANVDASKTTLTNTASSVRRSLGRDANGYLLEPVSSGLYHQRGVEFDVADFHRLVARSRRSTSDEAFDLYVSALGLVHGEPLASVLKGFEWFTFEGHRAQLQRDGEWVALALHDAALERNDVETAFWALRQGLLLDPESDELAHALQRVPRLRQFRGDGTSAAQDETIRPGRAVAMSWAFERFGR
ncbi:MAG: hypothetical protein PXZ08_08625 [Actinomycetota bacterium]|nr:hypothetical protein [Actinomycetota bacterium]